ncbi:toxin-antitoxin system HicB family antitoxin [Isoptericola croceus]|uniref:toxin-antitoxin system HicB family antitoxin n=1 Tax=Isoptericola croceus TaxID=3031406 RepID=UPI0023F9894E|nr:toxin-antitoxin system HicB family antitoxin [Isoptericola croceus]
MDLTRYVEQLQHQLAVAAAAGGDEARELAERLTAPLEAAVRLVLLEALSNAAGDISAELAPGSVDVRLRGGDPEFVVLPAAAPTDSAPSDPVVAAPSVPTSEGQPPAADADTGATTRTTLRLPDHLKAKVELAAARDGVSVNTWLVRAVTAAVEQATGGPASPPRPGAPGSRRHTGWVR